MKTKQNTPLRDDFRSALLEKLVDVLSRTEIRDNFFLNSSPLSELEEFDEKFEKKPTGKISQEFISDSPLMDFFIEALSEEIQRTRKYDSNVDTVLLNETEEYKDISALADRLLREFESLPREYKLYVKLPVWGLIDVLGTDRFELSDTLSIIRPNQEFQSTFSAPIYEPRRSFRSLFAFSLTETKPKLNWEDYHVYCEITARGFIGIYEDTAPIRKAKFLIRAFCGLSLALQFFETRFPYSIEDSYLIIYEQVEDKWIAKKPRILPTELVQGLEKLKLHQSYDQPSGAIRKRPTGVLAYLKKLFSNVQENERLLRAAQWYFDSYCGDNELLAYVKATICLEILLGDKKVSELTGIMELLRNRCAYLIGTDRKDREEILKDFNEIYNTRSQIVHSGKNTLTKLERNSLYKLRWLCARVIRKEVQLASVS